MDFVELETLRRALGEIGDAHVASLGHYFDSTTSGYRHKYSAESSDYSKASTATCVLSLIHSGKWKESLGFNRAPDLADALLQSDWRSAGLDKGNAFTVAFLLEAVTALERAEGFKADAARIQKATAILQRSIKTGGGGARIKDYPQNPYVTQLVLRALNERGALRDDLKKLATKWAWRETEHQLALHASGSKDADVFALAYAAIICSSLTVPSTLTPVEKRIQQTAIRVVFERQLPDGTWPQSRPLFHYPGVGNAYCYEYEMLVQLLSQHQLQTVLLEYLPNFKKSVDALTSSAFQLDAGFGWASNHHPQLKGPESWSTASVFHFAYALGRLVAEAVRKELFNYLDAPYLAPQEHPKNKPEEFAAKFLDCDLVKADETESLRDVLLQGFVVPIAKEADRVTEGHSLSDSTPMSAIFFGPPGTSKTQLAKYIAEYLGWPLLPVDPSHLVKNGMDQVQAEANSLFGMLASAERVVVLLDEFDEMVRDRASGTADLVSRFLTTAMLPKLTLINQRRRIVFILATNYIDTFDFAISRHGRFDVILQVMPPRATEKLGKKWKAVDQRISDLKLEKTDELMKQIGELTFGEFGAIANALETAKDQNAFQETLRRAMEESTLSKTSAEPDGKTPKSWRDRCTEQQRNIRW